MSILRNIALLSAVLISIRVAGQPFYAIPQQTLQPYKILGFAALYDSLEYNKLVTFNQFEIGKQVSLKAYKLYLDAVKKDSSYTFYLSQLPDSGITTKTRYADYISNKKYEEYPVAGISWLAAMNYCKWKTLQDNKEGKISFIYRLPKLGEWLAAFNFLETGKTTNDFSKNFSDWTMNDYFEGLFGSNKDTAFVYDKFVSLPGSADPRQYKRKVVAGNSYLFQNKMLIYNFATYIFYGYRQIGFRMVKESTESRPGSYALSEKVLAYWGITTK